MLADVEIKDFRCLRSVAVPLRPLSVLVGPNDSGKSAFLEALQYLATGTRFQTTDHWRHDSRSEISIVGKSLEGKDTISYIGATTQASFSLVPLGVFQLPSRGASMQSQVYADNQGPQPLAPDGTGVPGLLDSLLRRDRKRSFQVVETRR